MLRIQRTLPEEYLRADLDDLRARVTAAKATLGDRLFILGHHYQRDEIIEFADARGDSYRLSVLAQQRPEAEFIVFCGVHFMAESADVLTEDHQAVILPDLNAGCSMADMADIDQVEEAWAELEGVIDIEKLVPITYMNSSAALKAFVGRHGGAVCTSTNARAVLEWALRGGKESMGASGGGDKVLFFPDQHLGRNTGVQMGYELDQMHVWDPRRDLGGLTEAECKESAFLLWKGHCSIHQRFRPEHIAAFRAEHPDGIVVVHPEIPHETVLLADQVGSTDFIIKAIEQAPAGSTIAVGTEVHLVNRLAQEHPEHTIISLDPLICPCSTMNRIDLPHLTWVLEELVAGRVVNRIQVDPETTEWSKVALQRMLEMVDHAPGGRVRSIVKALAPPTLVAVARHGRHDDDEWRYAPTWPAVHETWDHASIAAAQAERFADFVAGVQAPNLLGVVPETAAIGRADPTVQGTYLAFAYTLARASEGRSSLRVVDWGGGLGQYHALSRALFPALELDWVCKELPDLVAEGRRLNPEVRFVTDDGDLPSADLVLASSSLHYVRDWSAQLAVIAGLARSWCYVTRLPTVAAAPDFVLVQDARRHGYDASYPGWVLNTGGFIEEARRSGLELEREVLIHDGPDVRGIPERPQFRGYLFRRGA